MFILHKCEAREQKDVYTGVKELRLDGKTISVNSVDSRLLRGRKCVEIRASLE
ncbi:MAG: hypothetical protein ACI4FY_00900 [Acetatifactor sp.]